MLAVLRSCDEVEGCAVHSKGCLGPRSRSMCDIHIRFLSDLPPAALFGPVCPGPTAGPNARPRMGAPIIKHTPTTPLTQRLPLGMPKGRHIWPRPRMNSSHHYQRASGRRGRSGGRSCASPAPTTLVALWLNRANANNNHPSPRARPPCLPAAAAASPCLTQTRGNKSTGCNHLSKPSDSHANPPHSPHTPPQSHRTAPNDR